MQPLFKYFEFITVRRTEALFYYRWIQIMIKDSTRSLVKYIHITKKKLQFWTENYIILLSCLQ